MLVPGLAGLLAARLRPARSWWLECNGLVDWVVLSDTVFEGEQLGRWVLAQRAGWLWLEPDQRDLLSAVGVKADKGPVRCPACGAPRLGDSWAAAVPRCFVTRHLEA